MSQKVELAVLASKILLCSGNFQRFLLPNAFFSRKIPRVVCGNYCHNAFHRICFCKTIELYNVQNALFSKKRWTPSCGVGNICDVQVDLFVLQKRIRCSICQTESHKTHCCFSNEHSTLKTLKEMLSHLIVIMRFIVVMKSKTKWTIWDLNKNLYMYLSLKSKYTNAFLHKTYDCSRRTIDSALALLLLPELRLAQKLLQIWPLCKNMDQQNLLDKWRCLSSLHVKQSSQSSVWLHTRILIFPIPRIMMKIEAKSRMHVLEYFMTSFIMMN